MVVDHTLAHPSCGFHLKTERRTLLNVPPTEDMMDRLYDIMGAQATDLVPLQQPPMTTRPPEQNAGAAGSARPISPEERATTFTCSSTSGRWQQALPPGHPPWLQDTAHARAASTGGGESRLSSDEVDVNVHPTKREVRLRHSWRVLERLERAIAYTLEAIPTEPDATGGIPGLQGLSTQQHVKSVETFLNPEPKSEPTHSLASAAGMATQPRPPNRPFASAPAWAVAAGKQLNLVGQTAEETAPVEKERPVSASPLGQSLLPGQGEQPVAAPLSSAERDLHAMRVGDDVSARRGGAA